MKFPGLSQTKDNLALDIYRAARCRGSRLEASCHFDLEDLQLGHGRSPDIVEQSCFFWDDVWLHSSISDNT